MVFGEGSDSSRLLFGGGVKGAEDGLLAVGVAVGFECCRLCGAKGVFLELYVVSVGVEEGVDVSLGVGDVD